MAISQRNIDIVSSIAEDMNRNYDELFGTKNQKQGTQKPLKNTFQGKQKPLEKEVGRQTASNFIVIDSLHDQTDTMGGVSHDVTGSLAQNPERSNMAVDNVSTNDVSNRMILDLLHQQQKAFQEQAQAIESLQFAMANKQSSETVSRPNDDHDHERIHSLSDSDNESETGNMDDDFLSKLREAQSSTTQAHLDEDRDISDTIRDMDQFFDQTEKTGDNIDDRLAAIVNKGIHLHIRNEKRKPLLEKYSRPGNCDNLIVPRYNRGSWASLKKQTKIADAKLQNTQNLLCKSLIPMLHLTSTLFKAGVERKGITHDQVNDCLTLANDSFKILQFAFSDLSFRRRFLARNDMDEKYRELCSYDNPVGKFLLGDDLEKSMKELQQVKQLASKFSASKSSTQMSRSYNTSQRAHPYNRFSSGKDHTWQHKPYQGRPQKNIHEKPHSNKPDHFLLKKRGGQKKPSF